MGQVRFYFILNNFSFLILMIFSHSKKEKKKKKGLKPEHFFLFHCFNDVIEVSACRNKTPSHPTVSVSLSKEFLILCFSLFLSNAILLH